MNKLHIIFLAIPIIALCSCNSASDKVIGRQLPELAPEQKKKMWENLLKYDNNDIKEDEQAESDFAEYFGLEKLEPIAKIIWPGGPWLFASFRNDSCETRYILVVIEQITCTPGSSSIEVYVSDCEGKLLSRNKFSTGHRIVVENVSKVKSPDENYEIILVETKRNINGRNIRKQYYAQKGDSVVLVRMEDPECTLIDNVYIHPYLTIGPKMDNLSKDTLIDNLLNGTWAEKLSTLMWISGRHRVKKPFVSEQSEEAESMKLAEKMLDSKRFAEIVKDLSLSEDKWIRENAETVLLKIKTEE